MIKRLFYAVLGFWLLKKYVLPYFDGRRNAGSIRRDVARRQPSANERGEALPIVERHREQR